MERVLIGRATTNTTSSYYHRSDKQGLFISRPGANVQNCSDGDLIFDSTCNSLVQVLTRGRASIPKQVYDLGLFGEANTVTSSNWNSPTTEPKELNAKTSWMFGGMKAVQSDITEMNENMTVTFPTVGAGYIDGFPDDFYLVEESSTTFFKLKSEFYSIPVLSKSGGFWDLLTNHGNVGDEEYVRTLIKNYWRILDVFPFFSGTILGIDQTAFDFGGLVSSPTIDISGDPGGSNPSGDPYPLEQYNVTSVYPWLIDTTGIPVVPEVLKPLTISSLEEYLPGGDLTHEDADDLIYNYQPWKVLWGNYIDENKIGQEGQDLPFFPAKTAYSGDRMKPGYIMPWRAWTTPETGKFGTLADGTNEEHAAVVTFYKMMVYFSWMYNNFGTQVINTNGLGFEHSYTANNIIAGSPISPDKLFQVNFATSAPSTRLFSEINPTNNFGNTSWTLGAVEISTGIDSPFLGDHPVQIWWNPVSAALGNTITNLSFLDIRDHFVKSSTSSERLTSLRPGMSSIHANTYIEDNEIKIKFSQPSTEEGAEVFFTAFKEIADENTLESNEGP